MLYSSCSSALEEKLIEVHDISAFEKVFDSESDINELKKLSYHHDSHIRSKAISILFIQFYHHDFVKKRVLECIKDDTPIIYFAEQGVRVRRNMLYEFTLKNGSKGTALFRSAFNLLFEFGEEAIDDLNGLTNSNDEILAREAKAAIKYIRTSHLR